MLGLIGIIFVLYAIIQVFGETAGAWAVGIVGFILIVAILKAMVDSSKAYWNMVEYWKDGGPNRKA